MNVNQTMESPQPGSPHLVYLQQLFNYASQLPDLVADVRSQASSWNITAADVIQACSWQSLTGYVREFWATVGPGGKLHPAAFLEHKGHLFVEGVLIAIIIGLFLQSTTKPKSKQEEPLTDKEIDQLVRDWEPIPLVPDVPHYGKITDHPVIERQEGQFVYINGQKILSLSNADYLGLYGKELTDECTKTIQKYGVGACGPRGFYGTLDVHLDLESQITHFMGTEESIIYSYDIATVASIIPAFANRKDLLLVDEHCSFPIQQGCNLSRARVFKFRHNDLQHLEQLMLQVEANDKKEKRPLYRRFVVTEGIFANSGDLAPVDKLYKLKEKYRYRLLVEESHSFGVLGKTGRGACEHFGLQPGKDVEVVCGSMGTALGSMGGFCTGSVEVVDHQRLSGLGYCFSAALPPFLATGAIVALKRLEAEGKDLLSRLHKNTSLMRQLLRDVHGLSLMGGVECPSPLIHLQLQNTTAGVSEVDVDPLQQLRDAVLEKHKIMLAVSRVSFLDKFVPAPTIKILVTAALSRKDIERAAAAIKEEAYSLFHTS